MRRIRVQLAALALAGGVALGVVFVSGVVFWAFGGDDQSPRAQTPPASRTIAPEAAPGDALTPFATGRLLSTLRSYESSETRSPCPPSQTGQSPLT